MAKTQNFAVMTFQRGTQQATIITDGHQYRTYTDNGVNKHRTLFKAIAHLEAAGYNINSAGLEIY